MAINQREPHERDQDRSRIRQQEALAMLGNAALASRDIPQFINEALRRLSQTLDVEVVSAWELLPEGRSFILRAGFGWRDGSVGHVVVGADASSPAGFALMAGEPVIINSFADEKRFTVPPLLREHHVVSGMVVAVFGPERPYGALAVHTVRSRVFSTDEVLFLRSVANVLAAAIRNQQAEIALRNSEARLRAIFDTAVEGIITIDVRGRIESINPAGCRMFGYSREELIGHNVSRLMPEPYQSRHDGYLVEYLRTGRARIIGIGREVVGLRKDDATFPLDLSVSEFEVAGRRMFTGVFRDITDRRSMEREILEAAALEQQRIGQDIHDGLCQELTGVSFAMEVLGRKLAARDAPETAGIRKVADLVDQSISHARNLAHGLQPVALSAAGLAGALQELAAKTESLFGVPCIFVTDGPAPVRDNIVANHLFRIAQEAIANAIKHGKAKTIVVDLSIDSVQLNLSITDDGIGLNNAAAGGKGIGLQTMLYRARVAGGALDIRPGPHGGTVVICSIPLSVETLTAPGSHSDAAKIQTETPIVAKARAAPSGKGRARKDKSLPGGRSSHRARAPRGTDQPGSRP